VLKQFLIDRGLLTAYTGGLSSYCLFLMVARYLQEQPSSWGDCGALLMGFLDFYGNCVSLFVLAICLTTTFSKTASSFDLSSV
jgi:DNA polymerase sigma